MLYVCLGSFVASHKFKERRPSEPRHKKPVFGVCDQLILKPACSADETS